MNMKICSYELLVILFAIVYLQGPWKWLNQDPVSYQQWMYSHGAPQTLKYFTKQFYSEEQKSTTVNTSNEEECIFLQTLIPCLTT